MSIQTELSRIINAKSSIKAAIEGKGVTVPDATLLDGMASLIESIEAGSIQIGDFTTVTYGSFQLAEDSSEYTIDLGYKGPGAAPVVEQFILLRDLKSTYSGTSTQNSLVVSVFMYNISSASTGVSGLKISRYYNSSGSLATSTASVCIYNDTSSSSIPRTMTIKASGANSNCVLTAGAIYCWIALRRES